MSALWDRFSALWSWAADEGGAIPLLAAAIITIGLVGVPAGLGFLAWGGFWGVFDQFRRRTSGRWEGRHRR